MDNKDNMSKLDHIVIASNDLEDLAAEFHELTGVKAIEGGRHEGKGTANQLIGLGHGAYIELIGPDPAQDEPKEPRPLKVDEVEKTTVVGWSVRPDNMDTRVAEARKLDYDPGDPDAMSRETPAGEVLKWTLTPLKGGLDGTIPFLIDWKDTKHPSIGLPEVTLISLTIIHPEPDKVRSALKATESLHLVTDINKGEVGLVVELDTPKGRVIIK